MEFWRLLIAFVLGAGVVTWAFLHAQHRADNERERQEKRAERREERAEDQAAEIQRVKINQAYASGMAEAKKVMEPIISALQLDNAVLRSQVEMEDVLGQRMRKGQQSTIGIINRQSA